MTPEEYLILSGNTNVAAYTHFTSAKVNEELVHAGLGVVTEAGEYLDALKKAMIYGKDLDLVNLDEEAGDILWYIALHCRYRKISFSDLFEQNIAKLAARYPDKFTEAQAINRDIVAERAVLEAYGKTDDASFVMILMRAFIEEKARRPSFGEEFYYTKSQMTFEYLGDTQWREVK